ncbi:MAG: hypothetical protein ABIQ88_13370 [Chitinophagaceae bacterium]
MSVSLDQFRAKLVVKILYAHSAAETERFVRAAIKGMEKRKVNGYITIRFIDRVINQISTLNFLKTTQEQYNNIMAATSTLSSIKECINIPMASV